MALQLMMNIIITLVVMTGCESHGTDVGSFIFSLLLNATTMWPFRYCIRFRENVFINGWQASPGSISTGRLSGSRRLVICYWGLRTCFVRLHTRNPRQRLVRRNQTLRRQQWNFMNHYDNVRMKYAESNRKNVTASSIHTVSCFQKFIHRSR